MLAYLTISNCDGQPPRRVAYNGIARLFAEDDIQDAPAAVPLTFLQRLATAVHRASSPLFEMAALLRDEHRDRQMEWKRL